MKEYMCQKCGYRKMEKESFEMMDSMLEMTAMGGYLGWNMMPVLGSTTTSMTTDELCPNCHSADGWGPVTESPEDM